MSSDPYDLKTQYKNATNLNARIYLHQRFSTNPANWYEWVFDHYQLEPTARILELGCGPATFWRANLERIPTGWDITLTDFSAGMLTDAQKTLAGSQHPFKFQQANAMELPFEDDSFDAVFAHHMLYHVPDRPKAYAEIVRVLQPQGRLYAATNGVNHMKEDYDITIEAFPEYAEMITGFFYGIRHEFSLENGAADLSQAFRHVERYDFEDSLHITEVDPLVAYILSQWALQAVVEADEMIANRLRAVIQAKIDQHGAVDIQKSTGLFICQP